jgi:hypothetical protein
MQEGFEKIFRSIRASPEGGIWKRPPFPPSTCSIGRRHDRRGTSARGRMNSSVMMGRRNRGGFGGRDAIGAAGGNRPLCGSIVCAGEDCFRSVSARQSQQPRASSRGQLSPKAPCRRGVPASLCCTPKQRLPGLNDCTFLSTHPSPPPNHSPETPRRIAVDDPCDTPSSAAVILGHTTLCARQRRCLCPHTNTGPPPD